MREHLVSSPQKRVVRGVRFLLGGVLVLVVISAFAIHGRALALGSIHSYQRHLSPIAAAVGYRCRFTPTCSRYAEVTIARDGIVRGGWLAVKRIARCGPWTPPGTRDEP